MLVLVKELLCNRSSDSKIGCTETLHFDTALSDENCRWIAKERYGWSELPNGRDVCPKHKEA